MASVRQIIKKEGVFFWSLCNFSNFLGKRDMDCNSILHFCHLSEGEHVVG
jgi:hypothetical protein